MAGSLAPVVYWAIHTILCSALRLDAELLPYQAVMQRVKIILMVHFEDLETHAKTFQSPEGENMLLCPVHNFLGVFRP